MRPIWRDRKGEQLARLEKIALDTEQRLVGVGARVETLAQRLEDVVRAQKKLKRILSQELREYRKLRTPLGAPVDIAFLRIAQPLLESRRTLLGYDRLYVLWQAARNAAPLRLPAAEVGVFRGGSAFFLAQALKSFAGEDRELHVVDTFEGHPDEKISEHDSERQRGSFADTSFEDVCRYLSLFPRVHVYKGEASTVLPTWPEMQFSVVHLDVDLYEPTLGCLEYFGRRLPAGGMMVLDDYAAASCPGVERAVGEYLAREPAFQTWNTHTEQLVLVKR